MMSASRAGTALVTGASSGIGLELATLLAADGYDLILVARRRDRLEELGETLARAHQIRYQAIDVDLADPAAVEELSHRLEDPRAIDVLINNAGFGALGPLATMDVATERSMTSVNVGALTDLTRLVLPGMVARRRGRILNVASTAGFAPGPFMAVYYATKAYVISFSEALAEELRGSGVTVTVLCPGPTRTEFQTVARMESTHLYRMPGVMDAAPVARAGYRGMMRGKRMVVPGVMNRILPLVIRFSPRGMVVRVSRYFQEKVKR
jgi:short-subunit dehydrogenase